MILMEGIVRPALDIKFFSAVEANRLLKIYLTRQAVVPEEYAVKESVGTKPDGMSIDMGLGCEDILFYSAKRTVAFTRISLFLVRITVTHLCA